MCVRVRINNALKSQYTLSLFKSENLKNLWLSIERNYLRDTQISFRKIREQREFVGARLSEIQRRFLELIQRNDNKFFYVRQYQEQYNKFLSDNADMIEEDSTKEELHQRVEDLHDTLFDIIESKYISNRYISNLVSCKHTHSALAFFCCCCHKHTKFSLSTFLQHRKDDATEERNQIIRAGFVESQMERFLVIVHSLVQAELSRSFSCQQLISDYYSQLNKQVEAAEVPENFKTDIQLDTSVALEEEEKSFPRLDKLYETAVRLATGEEEIGDDKGKSNDCFTVWFC